MTMKGVSLLSAAPVEGRADPLISALIEKLPPPGPAWSIEQRLVWLRMAAMAFDLAYGVDAPIEIKLAGIPSIMSTDAGSPPAEQFKAETVGPRLGKKRVADQRYVICLDGMAWDGNKMVTPERIGAGDMLWDFRPGEQSLDTVVWADGETRAAHTLPPLQVLKG
jgi:hypothetical protein